MLRLCEKVVNQNVKWSLKWTSLQIMETPGHAFVAVQIDACNCLQSSAGYDLGHNRGHALNVRKFGQYVSDFYRHGSAAKCADERRARRAYQDVRADACR